MNTQPASTSASSRAADDCGRARESGARERRASEPDKARFAKLLEEKEFGAGDSADARDKSNVSDDLNDLNDLNNSNPGAGGVVGTALPTRSPLPSTSGALGGVDAAGGAARAALVDARLELAAIDPEAAARFEVSMQERGGLSLQMQATREAVRPGEALPAWSLTLGTGAADTGLLARHLPRLNERLMARGVAHSHIRIDGKEEPTDERER